MADEIQLVSDGDGIAVIGEPSAVAAFVDTERLESRPLDLRRVWSPIGQSGAAVQVGSEIAANSGRWVKLTQESAGLIKKHGLMKSTTTGLDMGVVHAGGRAGIKGVVQFSKGPAAALASPAVLAGVGGIMAQVAMQQQMDAITDYLAVIDEKLDSVLRAQKDAVLSELDGVAFALDEARTIHEAVGHVSDITWSKVQASTGTIASVQARALRELDAAASKVERARQLGDKVKAVSAAEADILEWLAVIARTFQLQDAAAVLELDRVLDGSPDDLDRHRLGVRASRDRRVHVIASTTARIADRLAEAGAFANSQVLTHPMKARAVIESSNRALGEVADLHERLGIDKDLDDLESRRWRQAASEAGDKMLAAGTRGVGALRLASQETAGRTSAALRSSAAATESAMKRGLARRAEGAADSPTDGEPDGTDSRIQKMRSRLGRRKDQ